MFLLLFRDVLSKKEIKFKDLSIGIVGAGNVGSKVAHCANTRWNENNY